ncbi:SIMPL domain-containing protein [Sorangium sp. So ce1335]|uniref:SIMPL domain-containing protein n=1 Tax=Sorangium sp. So ce1335 TaxID=3133335 RepID=UPI003F5E4D27
MRTIEVSGHGFVYAIPDVSVLEVQCRVVDPQATNARATYTATMERISAVIRKAGVRGDDMRSSRFTLGEYYKEHRHGAAREGFYVEGRLSFRVRELTEVAPLFDELVAAGATRIEGPNLEISDIEPYRTAARKNAYEDALSRARTYCEVAGLRIVGPLQIQEDESSSAPARLVAGKMGMAGEDLLVGRQRVSVDVKVTFGIEPLGP